MSHDYLVTRRWIAGLSGVGAANMALGAARQFGIIRHLPDPPIPGFDSNRVITSPPAFALGIPDAPVALTGLLANIPLAFAGGRERSRTTPWLPIVIAAKAVAEVSVAAWYLVQMRTQVHAWCAYCLFGASISATIAVLSIREASDALGGPTQRIAGALGAVLIAGLAFSAMSYLDRRRAAAGPSLRSG